MYIIARRVDAGKERRTCAAKREKQRRCLALYEALSRKEGMAVAYGNLGALAKQRGNIAQACAHWRTARELFRQIGAKPMVEQVEGWMREAGCEMG